MEKFTWTHNPDNPTHVAMRRAIDKARRNGAPEIIEEREKRTMEKILVVVKEPNKNAEAREIERGLKPLQDIVGGLITGVGFQDIGLDGYANDEGLLLGMAPNLARVPGYEMLVGPVVVVGLDDEGEDISLTPDEAKRAIAYLDEHAVDVRDLIRLGLGFTAAHLYDSGESDDSQAVK